MKPTVVAALLGVLGFCLYAAGKTAKVDVKDAKGQSVGTATLTEEKKGGVKIKLDLKGLLPAVSRSGE